MDNRFNSAGKKAEETPKYFNRGDVSICTIEKIEIGQYDRLEVTVKNDVETEGRGQFPMSEKGFPHTERLFIKMADILKVREVMDGRTATLDSNEGYAALMSELFVGKQFAFMFGANQSWKWDEDKGDHVSREYSSIYLFGSVAEPTDEGVEHLKQRAAQLGDNLLNSSPKPTDKPEVADTSNTF